MIGFAYKITNVITGAAYIGVTERSVFERFRGHVRAHKREDSVLYRAMRKYGTATFAVAQIAEAYSRAELMMLERGLIAEHGTHVSAGGYNMTGGGEGTPDICDETRQRMRDAARARVSDQSVRAKISASLKGRAFSPQARAARIALQTGRPLSAEHRRAVSEGNKGKIITAEMRAKIAAALKGRKPPQAALDAAAAKNTGRRRPPHVIAAMRAGREAYLQARRRG